MESWNQPEEEQEEILPLWKPDLDTRFMDKSMRFIMRACSDKVQMRLKNSVRECSEID